MANEDYVTKKIPRHIAPRIRRLKARYELTGGKITEGQIIALAITRLEGEMSKEKPRYTLMSLAGSIKGGKKSSWRDIDREVYGI